MKLVKMSNLEIEKQGGVFVKYSDWKYKGGYKNGGIGKEDERIGRKNNSIRRSIIRIYRNVRIVRTTNKEIKLLDTETRG